MNCDECGKNKATVHLTEIVNEQITKLNLCEACAKKKGSDAEQHFGIADLLAALSDVEAPSTASGASSSAAPKSRCSVCGMTYEDFKRIGRLGCAQCYATFHASLLPLLKRIHGSNQHLGKSPTPTASSKDLRASDRIREELEAAKQELQRAIKKEEFEEAATLRDKVKFLEKKLSEKKIREGMK